MTKRSFQDLLAANWVEGKFLCVGLDPDVTKIPVAADPDNLINRTQHFLQQVIDATGQMVAAFKANVAFYEKFGAAGLRLLELICQYIRINYPKVVIILDGKRADVKSTSIHSASFVFGAACQADATTVSPYMGHDDALEPYLDRPNQGVFVLCRTSNRGGAELQDLEVMHADGRHRPLYQEVAARVAESWNQYGNCGLVMGATAPEQLAAVRHIAPTLPFLIPGIGKQGGDLEKAVRGACFKDSNAGFLINSSSGIIHPSAGTFPGNVIAAAQTLDSSIRSILQ